LTDLYCLSAAFEHVRQFPFDLQQTFVPQTVSRFAYRRVIGLAPIAGIHSSQVAYFLPEVSQAFRDVVRIHHHAIIRFSIAGGTAQQATITQQTNVSTAHPMERSKRLPSPRRSMIGDHGETIRSPHYASQTWNFALGSGVRPAHSNGRYGVRKAGTTVGTHERNACRFHRATKVA